MHEGPHGFSSDVALVPGHVITNEPGFCKRTLLVSYRLWLTDVSDKANHWGMRIESALFVKRVTVCPLGLGYAVRR